MSLKTRLDIKNINNAELSFSFGTLKDDENVTQETKEKIDAIFNQSKITLQRLIEEKKITFRGIKAITIHEPYILEAITFSVETDVNETPVIYGSNDPVGKICCEEYVYPLGLSDEEDHTYYYLGFSINIIIDNAIREILLKNEFGEYFFTFEAILKQKGDRFYCIGINIYHDEIPKIVLFSFISGNINIPLHEEILRYEPIFSEIDLKSLPTLINNRLQAIKSEIDPQKTIKALKIPIELKFCLFKQWILQKSEEFRKRNKYLDCDVFSEFKKSLI